MRCSFLKKVFGGHICPFWGPLVPLFWISGDIFSGFQSQSGFCLICIVKVNVMYIPQDPPLVLHVPTSWQPAHSQSRPHMHVQRWDLARIQTGNHLDRGRTRYHCASDPAISQTYIYHLTFFNSTKIRFYFYPLTIIQLIKTR